MRKSQLSESYTDTVRRLASAQKSAARGAPAYSLYVNRRVGRYLAALCFRAGLSPNAVTAISATLTFTGIVLVATARPSWCLGITVCLLLAAGYAFDSADGQVARLRGGGRLSGEWLDHVVDCIKITCLHLAVLISFFRFVAIPAEALLLVPIGYTVVAVTVFFAMILNDQLKNSRSNPSPVVGSIRGSAPLPSSWHRPVLMLPTDYGSLCLIFLALGYPSLFVALYCLLFGANSVHLVLALRKWFRDMVALEPQPQPQPQGAIPFSPRHEEP